jgi:cyclophilin family peptidyl-prolyl cis-trans isomerase
LDSFARHVYSKWNGHVGRADRRSGDGFLRNRTGRMQVFSRILRALGTLPVGFATSNRRVTLIAGALSALLATQLATPSLFANPFVRLDYNLFVTRARGTVFIELFDDRPLTRDNFLMYVNGGHFDDTLMHRMVRNFVIQGGGFQADINVSPPPHNLVYVNPVEVDNDNNPATPQPTVNNEFTNLPFRSNARGTLAMAKMEGNPNSATSEFFFNVVNNAGTAPNGLDFQNGGFTVFAQVVGDGMSLIDAYNSGLNIVNLNPDFNNNGVRDGGYPFTTVPNLGSAQAGAPLVLLEADRIDYVGTGSPALDLTGGLQVSARDAFFDTGTTFTGSGEILVAPDRLLGVREGSILAGRSLVNFGTLEPGLEIGQINLQAFRQEDGATLEIQLNGSAVDTGYDRVATTAGILLGGDLKVSTFGYQPSHGESYTILTAGTAIVDDFSNIDLFELRSGYVWNVSKTLTAYTLKVEYADFNRDGVVDAGDYIMWRKTFGTSVATAFAGADGNGDLTINDLDYDIWRRNLGNHRGGSFGGGGAGSSVPEPSSMAILLGGLAIAACRRSRRESTS